MKNKFIAFFLMLISIMSNSFGQTKNYEIESSVIDISSILDLDCLLSHEKGNFFKKINISYIDEEAIVRIRNYSSNLLDSLDQSNFFVMNTYKNYILTGNNLFYRAVSEHQSLHSDFEILIFKVGYLSIIGYSIDNLNVIDSLRLIVSDFFTGNNKDLVLKYLNSVDG